MSQRLVVEPMQALSLFCEACDWAERISLCLSQVDERCVGGPAWRAILDNISKLTVAIVNVENNRASHAVLEALDSRGVLRIATGDPVPMNADLSGFWRGDEGRALVAANVLAGPNLEHAVKGAVYATGPTSGEFFCGVRRMVDRCRAVARLPTARDLQALRDSPAVAPITTAGPLSLASYPIRGRLVAVTAPEEVARHVSTLLAHFSTSTVATDDWIERAGVHFRVGENERAWVVKAAKRPGPVDEDESVQFAIPRAGADRKMAAALARDEADGAVYLVHRGPIHRRSAISLDEFWAATRCRPVGFAAEEDEQTSEAAPPVVAVVCRFGTVEADAHLAGFVAELLRVRSEADEGVEEPHEEDEEARDFLEMEKDEQVDCVWDVLVGRGALPHDDAVRTAAYALRERGQVSYGRLDGSGHLYRTVSVRIEEGIREAWFDRPGRGTVRAVWPEPPRVVWRYCLLSVLRLEGEGVRMDRAEAVRATGETARELFGVQFKRLRRGGRIETSVKSAMNSCIRRGLVEGAGKGWVALASTE